MTRLHEVSGVKVPRPASASLVANLNLIREMPAAVSALLATVVFSAMTIDIVTYIKTNIIRFQKVCIHGRVE